MSQRLLHLLLVLTLALNGISAPWAMAHMDHGMHENHGAHENSAGEPTVGGEHAHHDGGHSAHGATTALEEAPIPAVADGSCCNGTACQCGCVLPPVLPLVNLAAIPAAPASTPFFMPMQHPAPGRGSPPFRPPAV